MRNFINSTVNTKTYNLMSDEHQIITITDKEAIVENIGTIVSGDTNSCLLTFEINRFQDGIDLSDKKIRFNYKNSNGKFYDIAVNVKYNDDVIRFSWLLPYSLTQPGGNVIASIEFYGFIEYDEQYSYKTKNFKLSVEKSLGVDDGSDESYNNWAIKIENDVEIIQKKISGIEKDIKDIHVPTKLSEMDDDTEHRTVSDSQIDTWNQAQKNVQSDWNETNINSDSYIKHKPTIPKVTNDLTDELKSSYDDAVTNSHVHNNKTVLDNIDDQYIKKWNSAYSHSISSHAPENAQENVIEDIKINGVSTAISDKTVNITTPTKTSDITNDSGFITNIANNLVNYYLKSEVYTKEEVQSLISRVSSLELIKVDALPTENIKTSAIYLVPSDQSEENNIYTEYIYIDGQWEIIGDTSVDLSQYALNKDVNEIKGELDKKITSPSTAEVGQTIIVKSVDSNGKPIEWEVTDLSKKMVVNFSGDGTEESPYTCDKTWNEIVNAHENGQDISASFTGCSPNGSTYTNLLLVLNSYDAYNYIGFQSDLKIYNLHRLTAYLSDDGICGIDDESALDNTLTYDGKAADALAVGTRFSEIEKPADWNQNDETQIDYIKNRPFYDIITQEDIIAEQTKSFTYSSSDNWYITSVYDKKTLTDGVNCKILWDGTVYDVVSKTETYSCFGDKNFIEYPFYFILSVSEASGEIYGYDIHTNDTSSSHTFRVYTEKTDVKCIDEKYLPFTSETFTFTLEDGTEIVKEVYVKS